MADMLLPPPKSSRTLKSKDRLSKARRSALMGRIRSQGNRTTELRLARLLRQKHLSGWRRHKKVLGLRPDFIFAGPKVIVFVDGCFWHGCATCGRGTIPTANRGFWLKKIEGNRRRDRRQAAMLRKSGWKVFRVWEHEFKDLQKLGWKVERLMRKLKAV